MKKIILMLIVAIFATCCVFDAEAAAPRRKSSAAATVPVGEPIAQIVEKNDTLISKIGEIDPQYSYQLLQTASFLAPAGDIAVRNPQYKLTAADKKALVKSFNKLIDSFDKPLRALGNTPAAIKKALTPIKTELAKNINSLTYLEGFYNYALSNIR